MEQAFAELELGPAAAAGDAAARDGFAVAGCSEPPVFDNFGEFVGTLHCPPALIRSHWHLSWNIFSC